MNIFLILRKKAYELQARNYFQRSMKCIIILSWKLLTYIIISNEWAEVIPKHFFGLTISCIWRTLLWNNLLSMSSVMISSKISKVSHWAFYFYFYHFILNTYFNFIILNNFLLYYFNISAATITNILNTPENK